MFELEINLRCKTIQGEQEFSVFDGERLAAKARTFSDGLFSTWFSGFNVTPEYERFRIGQLLIKMIDDRFPHTAVFVNASKTQTPAFIDSGFVVKRQLICCQRLRRCSIVETSKGFSDNQRGVEKSEMAMENENIRIEETTANVTQDALTNVYVSVNFGKHENYKDLHDMVAGMFGPGVFGFFAFDNENLIGLARVYSDDYSVAWIAEICVQTDYQKKGIGSALLKRVNERFQHTDLYAQPFVGQEAFCIKGGIPVSPKLAVCGRASIHAKNAGKA